MSALTKRVVKKSNGYSCEKEVFVKLFHIKPKKCDRAPVRPVVLQYKKLTSGLLIFFLSSKNKEVFVYIFMHIIILQELANTGYNKAKQHFTIETIYYLNLPIMLT